MTKAKAVQAERKRQLALKEARVAAALSEAKKLKAMATTARRKAVDKESECDKNMGDMRQNQLTLKKKLKALDKRLRAVRRQEEAAAAALQTAQAIESSLSDRKLSVKRTDAATRALADAKAKQTKA